MVLQVQLTVPDGHITPLGEFVLEAFEEVTRAAHLHAREAWQLLETPAGLDHLDRWASATVAVTERHQQLILQLAVLKARPRAAGDARQQRAVIRGVLARPERRRAEKVHQHLATVGTPPAKRVMRNTVGLAPAHLVGDEVRQSSRRHQRRQGPAEAEGIRQPDNARLDPEVALEVAGADEHLARERLTVRQIAIGLDPHAAECLPAALLHPLTDALERFGETLADHLVL